MMIKWLWHGFCNREEQEEVKKLQTNKNEKKRNMKMKNLKKIATTLTLTGIIMMGVTSANAGLLMTDFAGGDNNQPCTTEKIDINVDSGIIMSGLTGIIMSGLTGILMSDFSPNTCEQSDFGLLMVD